MLNTTTNDNNNYGNDTNEIVIMMMMMMMMMMMIDIIISSDRRSNISSISSIVINITIAIVIIILLAALNALRMWCHCVRYAKQLHRIFTQTDLNIVLLLLTHWGRTKMAAIFQTTFSRAFSSMKMLDFRLKFHWSLFLRVQLPIFQHWFRQ